MNQTQYKYIHRDLEKTLQLYLSAPEILAVIGPRQCGKTTLLRHIAESLPPERISWVDFEEREELELFLHDIKGFAQLHVKDRDYLFIDEFQYASLGGQNLKVLQDQYPIKILITGSSATELSIQSIRYLVGRIFVFHLFPFSFFEYMEVKEEGLLQFLHGDSPPGMEIIERINHHFFEYRIFGGYPRVAFSSTVEEKRLVLKNIFNTYLLKEIKEILQYRSDYKLSKLIRALALQLGGSINYNELSSLTEMNHRELREGLNILEKTFILSPCYPYFTNKRLELVKTPKFYFVDNGFRNMTIDNFQPSNSRTDIGALNENFVAGELQHQEITLRYWRTKSKAEVDFIVEQQGETIPIEVKSQLSKPNLTRSYRSYLTKYSPKEGFILSNNHVDEIEVEGTTVSFIPHWFLPSIFRLKK